MIISEIYIRAFAGLKDVRYRFDAGFHCIYGENETGKTTVMRFIRMMLYGGNTALRQSCAPLSGEGMSGYLDFSDADKLYRLERVFGKSKRSDKITVTDLQTGKQLSLSAQPGEVFLGLSEDTFLRTCFAENSAPFAGEKGSEEIKTRLQNLISAGDANVSVDALLHRLETAERLITNKSVTKGQLADAIAAQRETKEQLMLARSREIERLQQQQRLQKIQAEQTKLEQEKADFEAKQAEVIQNEKAACLKRQKELEELLSRGGVRLTRERLIALSEQLAANDPADTQEDAAVTAKRERLAGLEHDKAVLTGQKLEKARLVEASTDRYKGFLWRVDVTVPLLGTYCFGVLAVIALIGYLSSGKAFWGILLAVAAIIAAVTVLLHFIVRHKRLKLKKERSLAEQALTELCVQIAQTDTAILSLRQEIAADETAALQSRKEDTARRSEIEALLAPYGIKTQSPMRILHRLTALCDEYEQLSLQQKALEQPPKEAWVQNTEKAIRLCELEAATLRGSLSRWEEGASIAQLEQQLVALEQQIDVLMQKRQALQIAKEALLQSFDALQRQYGSILNRKTAEYFSVLTNGRYRRVAVDKDLHFSAMEGSGHIMATELLSAGTADQAYLALRLAIAYLIAADSGKRMPLFLDDVLMQYDSKRCEAAMQLLRRLAQEEVFSQVVLFTCRRMGFDT